MTQTVMLNSIDGQPNPVGISESTMDQMCKVSLTDNRPKQRKYNSILKKNRNREGSNDVHIRPDTIISCAQFKGGACKKFAVNFCCPAQKTTTTTTTSTTTTTT